MMIISFIIFTLESIIFVSPVSPGAIKENGDPNHHSISSFALQNENTKNGQDESSLHKNQDRREIEKEKEERGRRRRDGKNQTLENKNFSPFSSSSSEAARIRSRNKAIKSIEITLSIAENWYAWQNDSRRMRLYFDLPPSAPLFSEQYRRMIELLSRQIDELSERLRDLRSQYASKSHDYNGTLLDRSIFEMLQMSEEVARAQGETIKEFIEICEQFAEQKGARFMSIATLAIAEDERKRLELAFEVLDDKANVISIDEKQTLRRRFEYANRLRQKLEHSIVILSRENDEDRDYQSITSRFSVDDLDEIGDRLISVLNEIAVKLHRCKRCIVNQNRFSELIAQPANDSHPTIRRDTLSNSLWLAIIGVSLPIIIGQQILSKSSSSSLMRHDYDNNSADSMHSFDHRYHPIYHSIYHTSSRLIFSYGKFILAATIAAFLICVCTYTIILHRALIKLDTENANHDRKNGKNCDKNLKHKLKIKKCHQIRSSSPKTMMKTIDLRSENAEIKSEISTNTIIDNNNNNNNNKLEHDKFSSSEANPKTDGSSSSESASSYLSAPSSFSHSSSSSSSFSRVPSTPAGKNVSAANSAIVVDEKKLT